MTNLTPTSDSPAKKPAIWEAMAIVFVQMMLLLGGSLLFGVASAALQLSNLATMAFLLIGELLMLVPLILWVAIRGLPWRLTLGVKPVSAGMVGLGVLLAIAVWPVATAISIPFEWILSQIGPAPDIPTPATPGGWILFFLAIVVAAPIVEEPMFRGFVMRGLAPLGALTSVMVSGVLFGIIHGQLAPLVALMFVGILLGVLALRSQSIVPGIAMHAVFNFIGFVLMLFEAQLVWMQDWHFMVMGLLATPFLFAVLYYLFRVTEDKAPPESEAEQAITGLDISLTTIAAVLVLGIFGVFSLLDLLSRMMSLDVGA